MAFDGNGQIASRDRFVADLLKHEYAPEHGYCRETVAPASGVGYRIGQLIDAAGAKIVAGTEDTLAGVTLVNFKFDADLTMFEDSEVTFLARGPAIVAEEALVLEAGVDLALIKAELEAKGILVRPADQAPAIGTY